MALMVHLNKNIQMFIYIHMHMLYVLKLHSYSYYNNKFKCIHVVDPVDNSSKLDDSKKFLILKRGIGIKSEKIMEAR